MRHKTQQQKRRRRISPSSSSSSSSSHSLSSESEEKGQETKRFHIVSNDQSKWDFPSELTFYANTQFEKYIPGKSFLNTICEVYTVPNNLNRVKKMNGFLKDLLKEKNKKINP